MGLKFDRQLEKLSRETYCHLALSAANTTMTMALKLATVLRHTFILQQCFQAVDAKYSSGVRRGGFFPVWFPSMHGHRDCNDDDVECQQMSSVRGMDIFIIVILVLGSMACCFYCAYSQARYGQAPQPSTETNNQYVIMHNPRQSQQQQRHGTFLSNNTANQQLHQNQGCGRARNPSYLAND